MSIPQISIDNTLMKAKSFIKRGDIVKAKVLYKSILVKFPNNIRAFKALQALTPGNNVSKSETGLQTIIDELVNLYNLGHFEQLLNQTEKALDEYPNSFIIWNMNGAVNQVLGNNTKAEKSYRHAISLNPDFADGYNNLGIVLKDKGKFDEAVIILNKALYLNPDFAFAYNNLGLVLKEQYKFDEALEVYNKALFINANYPEPYNNIGVIKEEQGKIKEALDFFNLALSYKGDYIDAYSNLGGIKIDQLHLTEALEIFNKIISLNPDFALSHYNIGLIKGITSNYKEAIDAYGKALTLKPDFEIARAKMIFQQAHICDWDGIESNRDLIPKLGIHKQEVMPFSLLSLEDNPESHKKRSKKLVEKRYLQKPMLFNSKIIKSDKPIRVGYFSSDFKEHPVAYLIAGIIEKHNRGDFEIFGYAIKGTKKDNLNTRLSQAFDVFKDISHINDQEAALLAREDAIDIAIDLNGFTQNSRAGIFAYRAAPIQINYLGYPGTMGADFIDYIIADKRLIPEGSEKYYSEKPIYLPNTYMPTDNTREISTRSISRKEFGLPEDSFVFCCFNNNYKITSEEFDIWMRLLGKIKGSVLWLRKSNKWSESNFIKEAKKRGVDPSRLVFAGRAVMEEHLARHKLADLFLDTFNFNAHTTASEALWVGLPVITKAGKGFASRVASSLLKAIDLPELITETNKDYEALILDLATNPDKLLKIREKLKNNLLSKPLFDTELYIGHLETAYRQVYNNYSKGNLTEPIKV